MENNYFTLNEFLHTDTGLNNSVDNPNVLLNLAQLWTLLNFVREELGVPIVINSGYRNSFVNKQVGGVFRSYHMDGRAADIYCDAFHMNMLSVILSELYKKGQLRELKSYSSYYHIAI